MRPSSPPPSPHPPAPLLPAAPSAKKDAAGAALKPAPSPNPSTLGGSAAALKNGDCRAKALFEQRQRHVDSADPARSPQPQTEVVLPRRPTAQEFQSRYEQQPQSCMWNLACLIDPLPLGNPPVRKNASPGMGEEAQDNKIQYCEKLCVEMSKLSDDVVNLLGDNNIIRKVYAAQYNQIYTALLLEAFTNSTETRKRPEHFNRVRNCVMAYASAALGWPQPEKEGAHGVDSDIHRARTMKKRAFERLGYRTISFRQNMPLLGQLIQEFGTNNEPTQQRYLNQLIHLADSYLARKATKKEPYQAGQAIAQLVRDATKDGQLNMRDILILSGPDLGGNGFHRGFFENVFGALKRALIKLKLVKIVTSPTHSPKPQAPTGKPFHQPTLQAFQAGFLHQADFECQTLAFLAVPNDLQFSGAEPHSDQAWARLHRKMLALSCEVLALMGDSLVRTNGYANQTVPIYTVLLHERFKRAAPDPVLSNFDVSMSVALAYAGAAFGYPPPSSAEPVSDTGMAAARALNPASYKWLRNRIASFEQCMPLLAHLNQNFTTRRLSESMKKIYFSALVTTAECYEAQRTPADASADLKAGSAIPILVADAALEGRFNYRNAMHITERARLTGQSRRYRAKVFNVFNDLATALNSPESIKRLVPGLPYSPAPPVLNRVTTLPSPPFAAAEMASHAGALPLKFRPDDGNLAVSLDPKAATVRSHKRDAATAFGEQAEDFFPDAPLAVGATVPLTWNSADTDTLPPVDPLGDLPPLDEDTLLSMHL
jgi:hypothetical protein